MTFDDAYPYYYINNLRGRAPVTLNLTFSKMKGIEFLYTDGMKATLNVKGGSEGIILMTKETSYGPLSYLDSISVKRGASDLIQMAKQTGKPQEWKKGNQVVAIQYNLQHSDGYF
jgi:hypothetical protein